MATLFIIAFVIVGLLLAIPLSLYVTRSMRRNPKRSAGFVVATALLLSFPFLNGRGPEFVDEAKDTTRRKKDGESGDPPVAGGDDA